MLNIIWSCMVIAGITAAALTGNIQNLSEGIISSSKDAIDLIILMSGVVSMWSGFLSVAQDSGLTKELAKKMNPLLHYLFPDIPQGHPATDYISANFIANILGLGWACTPTGLEAMKSLQELEYERNSSITSGCKGYTPDTASDEMCTFLILNISSLQIIPMNLIAYRTGYGSADPMAVIIPGLITTSITTILAIIICRLMTTKRKAKI